MKYKTPLEHRTLTRARLDAAVYSLYLKLHDGKSRALAAAKFIRSAGLGTELLEDLRQLGRLTSTGTGRGQKHAWTGAPPTADLVDRVENLRELRAAQKAARLRARQELQQAREAVAPIPATVPTPEVNPAQAIDELLELRRRIDAQLDRLSGQPRLF